MHFKDAKSFMTEFNLDATIVRYIGHKTQLDAIHANTIKLREIAGAYSEKNTLLWIELWLASFCKFMDFEITDTASQATAMYLLEELYMVNLTEFSLFFKWLQKGKYGSFFGKFDGQKIIQAARQFRIDRGREISKMKTDEQIKYI